MLKYYIISTSILVFAPMKGILTQCPTKQTLENGYIFHISPNLVRYSCKKGYEIYGPYYHKCNKTTHLWKPDAKTACHDLNECTAYKLGFPCHQNALCENTIGSFNCYCRHGYVGNGKHCDRINASNFDNFLNDAKDCGISSDHKNTSNHRVRRIVGGQDSSPGQWPWIVLIIVNKEPATIFSGVLVKPDMVLTLASLLHDPFGKRIDAEDIFVSLGENDRNKPENNEQQFQIQTGDIYIHPEFNRTILNNDIAIIKLPAKAKITPYVTPICLAQPKVIRKLETINSLATITGWGVRTPRKLNDIELKIQTLFSGVLQHAELPLVNNHKCRNATPYYFNIKTMLCAGTSKNENAPCFGDGGSPLMMKNPKTKRWFLIGLFSWSEGCAQPRSYSYFTAVAKYRHWISEIAYKNTVK
ncbi:prothrombin [Hydra vulgaris]|uniref:prothrombin n=1 Tax=Hydra vulgaris TaxID=6087 RepID=UPI0001924CEA|nr:prothrombin-like [Hydra vulgaris]